MKNKNSNIEKTAAGAQIYFGKIAALQPKNVKKDKHTTGSPLFEQQPEDKDQINLFTNEGEADNGKSI